MVVTVVIQGCLYLADLYDLRLGDRTRELIQRISQALAVAAFILAFLYLLVPSLVLGRYLFVIAAGLAIVSWCSGGSPLRG